MKTTKATILTPRQSLFLKSYSDPSSPSFGNSYQSAVTAGYSDQTARNFMHLKPSWLSENLGQVANIIQPEEIMNNLTTIINDKTEPTVVRLKAIEMTMKAYRMLGQNAVEAPQTVTLNIDLSSGLAAAAA